MGIVGAGDLELTTTQRMLPPNEPIMDAVACWNGSTRRFQLRKKSSVSYRKYLPLATKIKL